MNNNLKFRTEIPEWEFPCEINHQTPLFFIGSCFADNISGKLQFYKFPVISNPFGTLYNPASVFNVLKAIETKSVPENLLLHKNELWLHYYFHSSVKNTSKTDFIQNFKKLSQKLSKHLSETKVAFITLGTSYVYELQNVIVGNCHKQPASLFTHRLLTLKETVEYLNHITAIIKSFNSDCHIIFTVSPVRYLQEGFWNNTLSKSTLHLAINEVINKKDMLYFPAFELLTDDLRDYRFYKSDLIHPNQLAIEYVWNFFAKSFFSTKTSGLNKKIEKIRLEISHKPFNPESIENKNRLKKLMSKIEHIETQHPYLDFTEEKLFVAKQLKASF